MRDLGLGGRLYDILHPDEDINETFQRARDWVPPPRDPLALDLDGDGIETTGVGKVVFDHNADGIKTGTGWLAADDGFVVWDRDGNSEIDSGRELFGVDTQKSGGMLAVDGVDALSDLDSNADGVFDAQDERFNDLQIWQDKNQDGLAQEDELSSFADLGVEAIRLSRSGRQMDLGNGNVQFSTAAFLRTNGEEGSAGAATEGVASNLGLAGNPFYREFADTIPLSEATAALPEMRGSGALRDLQEAAEGSAQLASALAELQAAGNMSQAEYRGRIETIVALWAASASFAGSKERASEVSSEQSADSAFLLCWLPPGATAGDSAALYEPESAGASSPAEAARIGVLKDRLARLEHLIEVLEPVNGAAFVTVVREPEKMGVEIGGRRQFVAAEREETRPSTESARPVALAQVNEAQMALLEQSYAALVDSVMEGLLLQTKLSSYMAAIGLTLDESGLSSDFSEVETLLDARWDDNHREALHDLFGLSQTGDRLLEGLGWQMTATLRGWAERTEMTPELRALLAEFHVQYGDATLNGTREADILLGASGDGALNGGHGDDALLGGGGNDRLDGGSGNDVLSGEEGNDTLSGGVGNDTLEGGAGNDIYLLPKGSGQDVISDRDGNNILRFTNVNADALTFQRSGEHLTVGYGTEDRVTLQGYYGDAAHRMSRVEFADGSASSLTTLPVHLADGRDVRVFSAGDDIADGGGGNDTLYGGAGNDLFYGGEGDDRLYGEAGSDILVSGAGDDALFGGTGNDTLYGGAGKDRLSGDSGNDLLIGGTGNDVLDGGIGDDVFVFSRGDGQDVISDHSGVSVIRFTDVNANELTFQRQGDHLMMRYGAEDQITLQDYFSFSHYLKFQVEFANGAVSSLSDFLASRSVHLSEKNDVFIFGPAHNVVDGGAGNDTVLGCDGNDALFGGEGDDRLYGGNDDDRLEGGAGNDVYQFSKGSGNDRVLNHDLSGFDVIRFEGVVLADLTEVSRQCAHLRIEYGTDDSVTVDNYFLGRNHQIDQFEFEDATLVGVELTTLFGV